MSNRLSFFRAALVAASFATFTLAEDAAAQTWRPEPGKNPSPTSAQIAEAKERYEKGVKLYEDEGNVQAARVEFERAYDLAPNYKVLYNVGQAARTLKDYASALRAFEAYLEGGRDKVAKTRVTEVQREIAQLRTYVATLTVQVDVEGATVALDGVAVGTSPLTKPLLVNAGRLTLTATKGGRVGTVAVTLAGGDTQTARVEVPGAPAAPTAPTTTTDAPKVEAAPSVGSAAPPPPPAALPRPSRTLPYLAIGIGGALGASAGATGFAAMRASDNLEKERFAGPKPSSEADDLRGRTQRLALASDVLAGAAVVSATIGVVLLVLEPKGSTTASIRPSRLQPFASPSGAGLAGTF